MAEPEATTKQLGCVEVSVSEARRRRQQRARECREGKLAEAFRRVLALEAELKACQAEAANLQALLAARAEAEGVEAHIAAGWAARVRCVGPSLLSLEQQAAGVPRDLCVGVDAPRRNTAAHTTSSRGQEILEASRTQLNRMQRADGVRRSRKGRMGPRRRPLRAEAPEFVPATEGVQWAAEDFLVTVSSDALTEGGLPLAEDRDNEALWTELRAEAGGPPDGVSVGDKPDMAESGQESDEFEHSLASTAERAAVSERDEAAAQSADYDAEVTAAADDAQEKAASANAAANTAAAEQVAAETAAAVQTAAKPAGAAAEEAAAGRTATAPDAAGQAAAANDAAVTAAEEPAAEGEGLNTFFAKCDGELGKDYGVVSVTTGAPKGCQWDAAQAPTAAGIGQEPFYQPLSAEPLYGGEAQPSQALAEASTGAAAVVAVGAATPTRSQRRKGTKARGTCATPSREAAAEEDTLVQEACEKVATEEDEKWRGYWHDGKWHDYTPEQLALMETVCTNLAAAKEGFKEEKDARRAALKARCREQRRR